jgi:hypothetical protein
MAAIKVGIEELGARVRRDAEEDIARATQAMRVSVHTMAPRIIQEEIAKAQPRQPVDRGTYRREWHVVDVAGGVMVYNSAGHAFMFDEGRRPGKGVSKAGQEEIARWAMRKGLTSDPREARSIAFLVARKMKAKGWPAAPNQPMRIIAKVAKRLTKVVRDAVSRAMRGEPT